MTEGVQGCSGGHGVVPLFDSLPVGVGLMGDRNEEAMEQIFFFQLIGVVMLDLWILLLHSAIPTPPAPATLHSHYRCKLEDATGASFVLDKCC